jgi:uncharacterized damage-inducible protein DinB
MNDLEKLRYPVGEFSPQPVYSASDAESYISAIEQFPAKLTKEVENLSDNQLDTPYRDGGWTIRQVVHHVVDSHLNSYTRFKLTLTEETPTIKTYFEDRWAELPEAKTGPIELSLPLLTSLHKRWVVMLKNLTKQQLERTLFHPELKREMTLYELLHLYGWHCEHHLAHITELKKRMRW